MHEHDCQRKAALLHLYSTVKAPYLSRRLTCAAAAVGRRMAGPPVRAAEGEAATATMACASLCCAFTRAALASAASPSLSSALFSSEDWGGGMWGVKERGRERQREREGRGRGAGNGREGGEKGREMNGDRSENALRETTGGEGTMQRQEAECTLRKGRQNSE